MRYATLAQALQWVANAYGCSASKDRNRMLEVVNEIRQLLYLLYAQNNIIPDVVMCFKLQHFCRDCDECRDFYMGITLPSDMETIESAWVNSPVNQVPLRTSWREWSGQIEAEHDCGLIAHPEPGWFSTERDIFPCGESDELVFFAHDKRDEGKEIIFPSALDHYHKETTLKYELTTNPTATKEKILRIKPNGGVVLPDDLCGGITLMQCRENRKLSVYSPRETVPAYRRYHIEGVCPPCDRINVRASRKYEPLCFDWEVVETGNQVAWDNFGRYMKLWKKSGKTAGERNDSLAYKAEAIGALFGQKNREIGNRPQTRVRFAVPGSSGRRRLCR